MNREQFIATYIASWLAARSAAEYDEHCATGNHPYILVDKIPVWDAGTLAEYAWEAYKEWVKPLVDVVLETRGPDATDV